MPVINLKINATFYLLKIQTIQLPVFEAASYFVLKSILINEECEMKIEPSVLRICEFVLLN